MQSLWKTVWISTKQIKNRTTIGSSSSPSRYLSEENENSNSKRCMYLNVCCSIPIAIIWKQLKHPLVCITHNKHWIHISGSGCIYDTIMFFFITDHSIIKLNRKLKTISWICHKNKLYLKNRFWVALVYVFHTRMKRGCSSLLQFISQSRKWVHILLTCKVII